MSPRRAISLFWGPSGLQGCHTYLCEVDLWPPATFPLHPAQLASASSGWMLLDTLTTQLDLGEAAVLKVSQWSLERNSFLLCPCGVSPLWNGLKKKRKRSKLYRQSYGDWEKLVQLHKELKRTLKKKKNTEIQRPFLCDSGAIQGRRGARHEPRCRLRVSHSPKPCKPFRIYSFEVCAALKIFFLFMWNSLHFQVYVVS